MNDILENNLPNRTERDLLIQQGTVLNKLCTSVTELKKNNADEHEKIFDKVDKVIVTKISNKLFFWLTGLMILVQIGLVAFVGEMHTQVSGNSINIEHIEHKLNRGD